MNFSPLLAVEAAALGHCKSREDTLKYRQEKPFVYTDLQTLKNAVIR